MPTHLTAIRKTAKGCAALYCAPGVVLTMADTGSQPMTTGASLSALSSNAEDAKLSPHTETPQGWLAPVTILEDVHHRSHTDVSQDPRYNQWGLSGDDRNAEFTATPRHIPNWVLCIQSDGGTRCCCARFVISGCRIGTRCMVSNIGMPYWYSRTNTL